jgi:hypothetical protein
VIGTCLPADKSSQQHCLVFSGWKPNSNMNKKTALRIMFFILGSLIILHVLILTGQIPYDKIWAGRLNSVEEMRTFETFSILLNAFMLVILVIKYMQLGKGERSKIVDILIWGFAAFFALNTVGNLFAKSIIELVLGSLVTLISAILCVIIVKKNKRKSQHGI